MLPRCAHPPLIPECPLIVFCPQISFAFSIMGLCSSVATTFNTPFTLGGPSSVTWCWILGAAMCFTLGAYLSFPCLASPSLRAYRNDAHYPLLLPHEHNLQSRGRAVGVSPPPNSVPFHLFGHVARRHTPRKNSLARCSCAALTACVDFARWCPFLRVGCYSCAEQSLHGTYVSTWHIVRTELTSSQAPALPRSSALSPLAAGCKVSFFLHIAVPHQFYSRYTASAQLVPRKHRAIVGWVVGWLNILGQILGLSSTEFGLANMIWAAVVVGKVRAPLPHCEVKS